MNEFQTLQLDLAARFASYSGLQYVTVFAERPRSAEELTVFQAQLNAALAGHSLRNGKAGLAVIVMMPEARIPSPHIPGPQMDLVFKVHVLEDVITNEGDNGTAIPAEHLALTLLGLGHLHKAATSQIFFADTNQLVPLKLDPSQTTASVGYEIAFRSPVAITPLSNVAAPVITVTDGAPILDSDGSPVLDSDGAPILDSSSAVAVLLSTTTIGAAIYFTLDGSAPWAENEMAALYSAPFAAPAAGTLLRVAAFKTGLAGSDVIERQF